MNTYPGASRSLQALVATCDRRLDWALASGFHRFASRRTQDVVLGAADTDRRSSRRFDRPHRQRKPPGSCLFTGVYERGSALGCGVVENGGRFPQPPQPRRRRPRIALSVDRSIQVSA